jgi:hypothetical protein
MQKTRVPCTIHDAEKRALVVFTTQALLQKASNMPIKKQHLRHLQQAGRINNHNSVGQLDLQKVQRRAGEVRDRGLGDVLHAFPLAPMTWILRPLTSAFLIRSFSRLSMPKPETKQS